MGEERDIFNNERSTMYKILISDKLGQAGLDRLDEMDDVAYGTLLLA